LRSLRTAGLDDNVAVYPTVEAAAAFGWPSEEIIRLRGRLARLEHRLESLPAIYQAKGMLMQDFGLGDDEAFTILRKLSQETNVKLREIARHVVTALTGTVSGETAQASLGAIVTLREWLLYRGASPRLSGGG
jgi:AmiR/NasT family two-component response regulator